MVSRTAAFVDALFAKRRVISWSPQLVFFAHSCWLDTFMRAVTERRVARLLTTTEKYLLRLSGLVFDRRKYCACV